MVAEMGNPISNGAYRCELDNHCRCRGQSRPPIELAKQRHYDPEFYVLESGDALATRVADGLSPRRDSCRATLWNTTSSTSRSSWCASTVKVSGHTTTPAVTAASSWWKATEIGAPSSAHSTAGAVLLDGTQHVRAATRRVRRAQPERWKTCNSSRSGASSGADAPGSTSTTTPRRCERTASEPFASIYDAWKVESLALRVEWWQSCRTLPVNWKLATAAFMEGYHIPQTHPQLLPSAQQRHPRRAHQRCTTDSSRPAFISCGPSATAWAA